MKRLVDGPGLPGVPGPMARLGERVYLRELARRNRRFDAGRGVVTIDRPVISVGNLSMGGTGKTPMVRLIVSWLLEGGHRPAIAMRGYKARGGISDEAEDHRGVFGGAVPVVAQPDRLNGLLRLFAEAEGRRVDVVVLDDGFQHRRIARQLDLVLIDGTRDPFLDRCLPAGRLREPTEALARASAVVITHAELLGPGDLGVLRGAIRGVFDGVIVETEHAWEGLRVIEGGEERAEAVSWLHGRSVAAACAIGHPGAFLEGVRRATGRGVERAEVFSDHHPLNRRAARRIAQAAAGVQAVVVTEKDWVKLRGYREWSCPVVVPRLAIRAADGGEGLRAMVLEAAGLEV
jgi:tetraacyldisaccharide 4'-kinase